MGEGVVENLKVKKILIHTVLWYKQNLNFYFVKWFYKLTTQHGGDVCSARTAEYTCNEVRRCCTDRERILEIALPKGKKISEILYDIQ